MYNFNYYHNFTCTYLQLPTHCYYQLQLPAIFYQQSTINHQLPIIIYLWSQRCHVLTANCPRMSYLLSFPFSWDELNKKDNISVSIQLSQSKHPCCSKKVQNTRKPRKSFLRNIKIYYYQKKVRENVWWIKLEWARYCCADILFLEWYHHGSRGWVFWIRFIYCKVTSFKRTFYLFLPIPSLMKSNPTKSIKDDILQLIDESQTSSNLHFKKTTFSYQHYAKKSFANRGQHWSRGYIRSKHSWRRQSSFGLSTDNIKRVMKVLPSNSTNT